MSILFIIVIVILILIVIGYAIYLIYYAPKLPSEQYYYTVHLSVETPLKYLAVLENNNVELVDVPPSIGFTGLPGEELLFNGTPIYINKDGTLTAARNNINLPTIFIYQENDLYRLGTETCSLYGFPPEAEMPYYPIYAYNDSTITEKNQIWEAHFCASTSITGPLTVPPIKLLFKKQK